MNQLFKCASWTHESASNQYSHHLKIVEGMKQMDATRNILHTKCQMVSIKH